MTIKFLAKKRTTADCAHPKKIRIEVVGMSREVCESCGLVSLGYVSNHFDPDASPTDTDVGESD